MQWFYGVLLLCSCVCGKHRLDSAEEEYPEVNPPIGRIRGSIMFSRLNRMIYAFRGVRYAEPPTGLQRFQMAVPAEDWEDVFDATNEGPSCPQIGGAVMMSEDCLRLNVYTTTIPPANASTAAGTLKPVIVFIHPGGFYGFSAQSFFFGPQYLLDKDIVLVTVNYRLALLGFLSTGDSLAPGNLAFKDQVVALRWIQRNIAAFGGDPKCVTITGYSVGSLSVMLHMVSPMSKDLFHRAVCMSGSILGAEPLPHDQKDLAKKQAELLGCPTDTTGSMLICMISKPADNFTATISKFFEWNGDPMLIWKPVVEPVVRNVERFLPAQPIDLVRQGKFHKVPLILGVTKDEFGGIAVAFDIPARKGNSSLFEDMDENWERIAPISLMYERDTNRSRYISRELRQFYFKNQPISTSTLSSIADIYADITVFPVHRAVTLFSERSTEPVYFYKFTHTGRYSFAMWNSTVPYGVVHHDDMQYLFYISTTFPFYNASAPEVPMIELMTSMAESFAKTGNPIPRNNELFRNITWEKYTKTKDNYFDINVKPSMKTGFFPERVQLWDRLFPLNRTINSSRK